jgi:hypothetical protein
MPLCDIVPVAPRYQNPGCQAHARLDCRCELDSHLQPWDKDSRLKKPLTELYDRAPIWV